MPCSLQLARLNARLQQQGLSLLEVQRPMLTSSAAAARIPRAAGQYAGSNGQPLAHLQSLPYSR